ncbi:hypothetical protein LTS18_000716 [Coniosporium uncinatum]|uniref:Uncharacterized protein n=1 Tax=Coniosporium uncinatum TaxID=93489 RepID=A0ACC3D8R5_9PEZI|nr:hypothetical protein LTS18_000716 [Coniosporium uncinatum]
MSKAKVPDAWDDDWENVADKQEEAVLSKEPEPEPKLSKAERRAKHAEQQRKLWDAAESPERPIFLQARHSTPVVGADFKPTVKLLSRKPPPKIASRSAVSDMGNLNIQDDEDDSEEEARKKYEASFAERQVKAAREREEKQRKYQERREQLFGTASNSNEEQKRSSSSQNGSRNSSRGKGRGRSDRENQLSPADDSPARLASPRKQLYDPGYSVKPDSVYIQKRDGTDSPRPATPGEQPFRQPKGPEPTGRGSFGFAPRGGKTGTATS